MGWIFKLCQDVQPMYASSPKLDDNRAVEVFQTVAKQLKDELDASNHADP